MIEIKDLLSKWSAILVSEESKTELLRGVIGEVIKLKIKPEDIRVKNNTVYLNIKPIYKSEILMKREEIFNKLQIALGKVPSDIR